MGAGGVHPPLSGHENANLWFRRQRQLAYLRADRYNRVVIGSFADSGTEDVFNGADTRAARKSCPKSLWPTARRKLDQINRVRELQELAIPPGNRLERLRGDRVGQQSIRINQQYRVCFYWESGHAEQVEIVDYH